MKLSIKSQYALEALVDLQLHAEGGLTSIGGIAERRGIPVNYLEQILLLLRKSGIVSSTRGVQGGYSLAQAPEAITAGEIIRALEGPLCPVKCVDGGDTSCRMRDCCPTRGLWARLSAEIDGILDGVTLSDLAQSCQAVQTSTPEYSI